jgi:amidohydrolase
VIASSVLGWFHLSVLPGWIGLPAAGLNVSACGIARSVLIFLGIALAAGFLTRRLVERVKGRSWYAGVVGPLVEVPVLIGLARVAPASRRFFPPSPSTAAGPPLVKRGQLPGCDLPDTGRSPLLVHDGTSKGVTGGAVGSAVHERNIVASDYDMARRRLLKSLGLTAAAGTAAMISADPVLGATLGYDEHIGVRPATYKAPASLARDSDAKSDALAWIKDNSAEIIQLNDAVWKHAELSLREWKSSLAVAGLLKKYGFDISWGPAGFPAAFVATYGSGGPVIGFNAEYDALPGLSQKAGVTAHDPLEYNSDPYAPTYGAGHGDAHNALGAGATAAAIAVSQAIRTHGLKATVKVFGTTAEEHLVGKPYMVKAGVYDGLDAFMDWHPFNSSLAFWNTTSALISATYTFLGATGHGANPLGNKSGLDGTVLMATMSEFLREKNLAPSGRFQYAIVNGGGAPNVTPDMCSIWFFMREGSPARTKVLYDKITQAAKAAAQASQTTLVHKFNSGTWNLLGNKAGAELMNDNMRAIGPPVFTDADQTLAKALQHSLGKPEVGMPKDLIPLTPPPPTFGGGISIDTADVSWQAPTLVALVSTFPAGLPNHSWAVTSAAATNIGHQGMLYAARYLAAGAIDLITQPDQLAKIKDEFEKRKAGVKWASMIPEGTQPPLYEPPAFFLKETRQQWPPKGIDWPVREIISAEKLGTTGPDLPPVT